MDLPHEPLGTLMRHHSPRAAIAVFAALLVAVPATARAQTPGSPSPTPGSPSPTPIPPTPLPAPGTGLALPSPGTTPVAPPPGVSVTPPATPTARPLLPSGSRGGSQVVPPIELGPNGLPAPPISGTIVPPPPPTGVRTISL